MTYLELLAMFSLELLKSFLELLVLCRAAHNKNHDANMKKYATRIKSSTYVCTATCRGHGSTISEIFGIRFIVFHNFTSEG